MSDRTTEGIDLTRDPYGLAKLRRAFEDSQHRTGMVVGLPKVTIDASHVNHALVYIDALRAELQRLRLSGGASEPPTNSVSVSSLLVGGAPEPSETLYTAKDVEALFAIRDAAVAAHTAKPVATAWMNGGVMENAFPRAPRTPEEWAQHDSDGYWSAKGYSELPLYFGPPSPPEPGVQQAGLPDDPAALKRIVMRHVRWRQEALGFLQQVHNNLPSRRDWPELCDFMEASTARLVAQSVICPNCDTALPEGCRGANTDDGDSCWLNRQPETKGDKP